MSIRSTLPLLIFLSFDLLGQKSNSPEVNQYFEKQEPVVIETEYYKNYEDMDGYSPYKVEYSVIKRNGEIIKADKFRFYSIYNEGLAVAFDMKSNSLSYVDENLKKLIEFKGKDRKTLILSSFFDGLAWIKEKSKDPILINMANEKLAICKGCQSVKIYSEGLAGFKNKDGRWGFMDKQGNTKFLLPEDVYYVSSFSDGLAQFYVYNSENNGICVKFGYVDKEGKIVINPIFTHCTADEEGYILDGIDDDISSFKNGYAKIFNEGIAGAGLINKKGEIVVDTIYTQIEIQNNGLLLYEDDDSFTFKTFPESNQSNLFNSNKELQHNNNLFPLKKNGKYGYVNSQKKRILPPIYEQADNFYMNYANVTINGKKKLINKSGKVIYTYPSSPFISVSIYNKPWLDYIEGGGLHYDYVVPGYWSNNY
jgi:hypothetical protein